MVNLKLVRGLVVSVDVLWKWVHGIFFAWLLWLSLWWKLKLFLLGCHPLSLPQGIGYLFLSKKRQKQPKREPFHLHGEQLAMKGFLQTIKQARCQVERKRTVIEEEGLQSVLLIARCAAHLARVSLMIFKSGRCS